MTEAKEIFIPMAQQYDIDEKVARHFMEVLKMKTKADFINYFTSAKGAAALAAAAPARRPHMARRARHRTPAPGCSS